MIKTILQSKWWWFIPIVSIFYIEQQSEWAFDAKTAKEYDCRLSIVAFMLLVHIVCIATILYNIYLKQIA